MGCKRNYGEVVMVVCGQIVVEVCVESAMAVCDR